MTPKILTLRDPDTGGVTKLQLFHRCLSSQEDTPTDKDASCRAKNMPQRTTRYLVFFVGDDVQQAGCHPEVVRLQRPEEVCKHLLRTFEATVQDVIVVMPSRYEGGFACYDNFLDGPWDLFGEPMKSDGRYVGEGLKASRHLVNILAQVFKQHERTIWKREWILIGFSKGGAVVNQLLTEMACLGAKTVVDDCVDRFFSLLSEIHYVDVGLNCPGAYLTDPCVFSGLKSWFKEHINTARNQEKPSVEVPIHLHGSFRQWGGMSLSPSSFFQCALCYPSRLVFLMIYVYIYGFELMQGKMKGALDS